MKSYVTACDVCGWKQGNGPLRQGGSAAVPGAPVTVSFCVVCLAAGATTPRWLAEVTLATTGAPTAEDIADWFLSAVTFKDGEYMTVGHALKDYRGGPPGWEHE